MAYVALTVHQMAHVVNTIFRQIPETVMNVREMFDSSEGAGLVTTVDHGYEGRYNYYIKSNQMFLVQNMKCEVTG